MTERLACGWSSLVPVLVDERVETIFRALREFVPDAAVEQHEAWRASLDVLRREGTIALGLSPAVREQGAVLEYELPRDGGRRPDVVVLQNGVVTVLEFKSTSRPRREDLDPVAAYARDLRSYHSACASVEVLPVLVFSARTLTASC